MRSADVVSHSEMAVSPIKVKASSRPICVVVKPTCTRYSTSTTDRNPYANSRAIRVVNKSRPSDVSACRVEEPDSFIIWNGNPFDVFLVVTHKLCLGKVVNCCTT